MTPKRIDGLTIEELGVDQACFDRLGSIASIYQERAWSAAPKKPDLLTEEERGLVTVFKSKLKKALFSRFQGPYCCYCSIELQDSQRGYDAEHVISKAGRGNVVFALANLAISCQPCNTAKHNKKTTVVVGADADSVLIGGANYLIVHPHYDEWTEFFCLDKYRRVVPKYSGPNIKASNTIEMCGIERFNAIRLVQYFDWIRRDAKRYDDWMDFYQGLYAKLTPLRRKRLKVFAESLLGAKGDPAADELYGLLKERIEGL